MPDEPAEPPPAPATTWANDPEPALRALQTALDALDTKAAKEWREDRALPRPDGVPPDEPPPDVTAALEALVAWDGSGALAPIDCIGGVDDDGRPIRLLVLAQSAIELSATPMDPPAHAALRLASALRFEQNDPLVMMIGASITKDAAKKFALPPSLQVTADLPWSVVAANARCVNRTLDRLELGAKDALEFEQALAQMGRPAAQGIAEEKAAVRAFWATTMEQVAQAKTPAALLRVLEQRIDDARASRQTSMLVPILGPPYAAASWLRDDEP
jgi:hypothetical protein